MTSPLRPEARQFTSLLWPPALPRTIGARVGDRAREDIDLAPLIRALAGDDRDHLKFVAQVLTNLPADPQVVAYRLEILSNLLGDEALRSGLVQLLPRLSSLIRERHRLADTEDWTPADLARGLSDLELYVEILGQLNEVLTAASLDATGLSALQADVVQVVESPAFRTLQEELPPLRSLLERIRSVSIGVNLSEDLRPESATILSVSAEPVEGRSTLLGKLLPETSARGITPLRGGSGSALVQFFPFLQPPRSTRSNDLVDDLQRLLERIVAPIGDTIRRHLWARSHDLLGLYQELSLLLGAAELVHRMQRAGLPMCRPRIAPSPEAACRIEDCFSISLALRAGDGDTGTGGTIVTNSVVFDNRCARVWVLTGPNRGGKTTYLRAVGQAHVMFAAGLWVPGSDASISLIDGVFTHFPAPETGVPGQGRLDDEAARLAEIFKQAGPHSLILLNEVLSGTSTAEALALALDAVRGLRLLGARTIYVTHLHELAQRVDEINTSSRGAATVGSLVAEIEAAGSETEPRRTFRVRPSAPSTHSYASHIARQHGISYPQLVRLLADRGLVAREASDGATRLRETDSQ